MRYDLRRIFAMVTAAAAMVLIFAGFVLLAPREYVLAEQRVVSQIQTPGPEPTPRMKTLDLDLGTADTQPEQ